MGGEDRGEERVKGETVTWGNGIAAVEIMPG